jgi:rhodanese-related sulfurtransferase
MNTTHPTWLIETDRLEDILYEKDLLIVDLGKADTYRKLHIPGAVFVDYNQIVAVNKPAMGQLPDDGTLQRLFSTLGIGPDTYVVAYDDEGGGRAARFLWTLEVAGHTHFALLNGGLHAWANEGHPYNDTVVTPTAATFELAHNDARSRTAPTSVRGWEIPRSVCSMCAVPRSSAVPGALPSAADIFPVQRTWNGPSPWIRDATSGSNPTMNSSICSRRQASHPSGKSSPIARPTIARRTPISSCGIWVFRR